MAKNYHVYRDKQIALAIEIGAAITRWVNLEGGIIRLCAIALGRDMRATAHLLSNFKTFALVLDFTSSAVKLKITDTRDQKLWNSLTEFIRELSGDRNYIAHAGMVAHSDSDPNSADWAEVLPFVGPTQFHPFVQLDRRDPMDVAEVSEIVQDIQHAIEKLSEFTRDLEQGGPWPDSDVTPSFPPAGIRAGRLFCA
ncbi:MAG: hypothetical protein R3E21_00585 [Caenibius sp.]